MDSFKTQVFSQINQFVENQVTVYFQKLDKMIQGECERIVGETVSNLDDNFWTTIQDKFDDLFIKKYERFREIMTNLELKQRNIDTYLEKFQKDSFDNLETSLRSGANRFKEALFMKFKAFFLKNQDGEPRDWKKQTEEEILHFFNESRDKVFTLLDVLKVY